MYGQATVIMPYLVDLIACRSGLPVRGHGNL